MTSGGTGSNPCPPEKKSPLPSFFQGGNPAPVHWLPKPFCAPQSGQSQVMLLQDMPHTFSSMQLWQMENPHLQVQQKGTLALHRTHS